MLSKKAVAEGLAATLRVLRVAARPTRERQRGDYQAEAAAAITVAADPEDVARDYALLLLGEARDELGRADQKASILLAAVGVGIGAVVAGMIQAPWSPDALAWPWNITWRIGGLLVVSGSLSLAWAIYPRTRHGSYDEPQLFYFRQAASVGSIDDLERELRRSAERPLRRSADQLWRISRVVSRKYRAVQIATWLISVGGLVALGSSILG